MAFALFWRNGAVVSDPAGVRQVLNEAADKYRRPVMAYRALRPIGGDGVFLAEGADWRRQRKMLSPLFIPPASACWFPIFTPPPAICCVGSTALRRAISRAISRTPRWRRCSARYSRCPKRSGGKSSARWRGSISRASGGPMCSTFSRDRSRAIRWSCAGVKNSGRSGARPSTESSLNAAPRRKRRRGAICSTCCSPCAIRRQVKGSRRPKSAINARPCSSRASRPRRG